jgi:hypothetical protein
MRTETTSRTLYSFDELSDEAKAAALDHFRDIETAHEWYDGVYEDAKQIGKIYGIEIDKIYFSGFSSQGDGAQFTGSYSHAKGSAQKIKEYAPLDPELHRIGAELSKLQRRNFYSLRADVTSKGRYSHEYCTDIDVRKGFNWYDTAPEKAEEQLKELLRDFMRWIYRTLEKDHDYFRSDECVTESIEANEYEFTEDGIPA